MTIECQHGQLARSCEICERDQRIAELEREVERLREQSQSECQRLRDEVLALEREVDRLREDNHELRIIASPSSEPLDPDMIQSRIGQLKADLATAVDRERVALAAANDLAREKDRLAAAVGLVHERAAIIIDENADVSMEDIEWFADATEPLVSRDAALAAPQPAEKRCPDCGCTIYHGQVCNICSCKCVPRPDWPAPQPAPAPCKTCERVRDWRTRYDIYSVADAELVAILDGTGGGE